MKHTPIVLIMLILLVACGSTGTTLVTDEQLCAHLQALQTSVNELKSSGGTATVIQLRAGLDKVSATWSTVKHDLEAARRGQAYDVEAAYASLNSALTTMPDDTPPADAKQVIDERTAALRTAWQQLNASVKCA